MTGVNICAAAPAAIEVPVFGTAPVALEVPACAGARAALAERGYPPVKEARDCFQLKT